MPTAQIDNAVARLTPLLLSLRKLGALEAAPITRLDAELPLTAEVTQLMAHFQRNTSKMPCETLPWEGFPRMFFPAEAQHL